MPVTSDKPAPYGPTSAIVELITRYRDKGLPNPITFEVLGRAGVSDSLVSRTLQSLATLDLIDDDGMQTKAFEALRVAPQAEFQTVLQEWLRKAYAEVFQYVDPADDETSIRDAFRNYRPMGQQQRMVTLFLGLCLFAGLREQSEKPQRKPRKKTASPSKKKVKSNAKAKGANPSIASDTENSAMFQIPIPGKPSSVIIHVPNDIKSDDWEMVKMMLDAYVKRLVDAQVNTEAITIEKIEEKLNPFE